MDKKQIRKEMKAKRANLTKKTVATYSSTIWSKIYEMPSFKEARTILLYSSIGNEVDTVEIAKKALAMGKVVAYPVTNVANNTMVFYGVTNLNQLKTVKSGSFVLQEPILNSGTKITPNRNTLMIVPGVAFDKEGYRVGYGGGFYDRYIDKHRSLNTIGVCYDFQLLDQVPRHNYDQAVGVVVTELIA